MYVHIVTFYIHSDGGTFSVPARQAARKEGVGADLGGGVCGEGEGYRVHTHPEKPKGTGGLISLRSTDVLCSHNLPIPPLFYFPILILEQ